jgi:protein-tyrosine phosphatase
MAFSVLFVCTGNICRSPLGERLLKARISDGSVLVASAGTAALVGRGIDGPSALVLRELGGDPEGHSAQRITRALVAGSDLILTAETAHRSAILKVEPTLFRRTFTMREFARLGASLKDTKAVADHTALRSRVAEVAGMRGRVDPGVPGADEIGDPYGANLDVARRVAGQISDAVDAALVVLGING